MANIKLYKTIAFLSALALSAGFAGCGTNETDNDSQSGTAEASESTVAVNTEKLNEEEQQAVNEAADSMLEDIELENKTIKWLAHYDAL